MAGEDEVLISSQGRAKKSTIEDNLHTYSFTGSLGVGSVACMTTTADTVEAADNTNSAKRSVVGIVQSVSGSNCAIVAPGGIATGLSSLSPGSVYWAGSNGALQSPKPAADAILLGVAISATALVVTCSPTDLAVPPASFIQDADNDTKIESEQSLDEDKLRFSTAGSERLVINADGGMGFGPSSTSGAPGAWNFFNFKGGGVRVVANNFYADNDRGILWGDSSVSVKANATAGSESLTVRANYNAFIHVDGVNNAVGIGTVTPGALLHVEGDAILAGSQKVKVRDVSATSSITTSDYCIRCAQTSAITLTLPSKTSNSGQVLIFKDALGNAGTNNVTITAAVGDTIDGSGTYVISHNKEGVNFICDGINGWMMTSRVKP